MKRLSAFFGLAGLALAALGAGLIYLPAGLIVAGGLLYLDANLPNREGTRHGRDR